MEKNAKNIILFRCSKALYFHTFSKMFLSNFICSGMLKIAPKALHFLKFLRGGPPIPPPRSPPGILFIFSVAIMGVGVGGGGGWGGRMETYFYEILMALFFF